MCDTTVCGALWQHAAMHDDHLLTLLDSDRRRLVRAATRLLGPADAEDAVQDAYVRALEADTLALNAAQAWLLTVVRNLSIDRLRRRSWMQQWLAEMSADVPRQAAPSAESDAVLAQEVAHALHLLAVHLAPEDGAAVLLLEVFDVGHAEIARAGGRSEASSRQQLRRALLRLRQAGNASASSGHGEREAGEETVFRLYLQALQLRDPKTLWAILRQPPIQALAGVAPRTRGTSCAAPAATCGVVQVGGQLGLVLTLDGVTLCVVPLGAQSERDPETLPG
ncbi:sigma-70 family RNA polymerase sigma factor [Rhodoferax sp. GW822-FHT02A01]|uniref:sigma-70 family RNA polymerase sigma factor n=1 Tax=Rhodoferax sp. GW822-FHT02A01 TaxID=3141537 RepID=UPI00315CFF45